MLLDANLLKKLPAFCGNPKFITVYKKPPFVCVLSQINPLHAVAPYCFKIDFNLPFHTNLVNPNGSSLKNFRLNLCLHFSSLQWVLYAAPKLILLDSITRILFGD